MLVIFDLDGTLLNTIADLGAACNHALAQVGFPVRRPEEYPHLVGNGVNKLLERALPDGHKKEETVLLLRQYFIPYYNDHNRVFTQPYEGIVALLHALRQRGHRLAVASNKYQAATSQLVSHFFGNQADGSSSVATPLFDVVLGEREGVERKPNPQIVYDIMAATGITDKAQVLYVGDSDVDMQTAKNAGVKSVACTWGFCQPDVLASFSPDFIIRHPDEFLPAVFG